MRLECGNWRGRHGGWRNSRFKGGGASAKQRPECRSVYRPMELRVSQAVMFMSENCHQALSVELLARRCGLSSTHFAHLFQKETGVPPYRMLKAIRMRRARELLQDRTRTIKEIMALVGVKDKNDFRRDFKTAFGLTPREYRRGLTHDEGDTPVAAP